MGTDSNRVAQRVAEVMEMKIEQVTAFGKSPQTVKARSPFYLTFPTFGKGAVLFSAENSWEVKKTPTPQYVNRELA